MNQKRKEMPDSSHAVGIAFGLLVFSLVALIGIVMWIDPFVITQRAIIAGVGTYFVTQLMILAHSIGQSKRRG